MFILNENNPELMDKILNLIRNSQPNIIDANIIEFKLELEKSNKLKIYFDKNSLEFRGWETVDAYSNNVVFLISEVEINNIIDDSFFRIPKENEL